MFVLRLALNKYFTGTAIDAFTVYHVNVRQDNKTIVDRFAVYGALCPGVYSGGSVAPDDGVWLLHDHAIRVRLPITRQAVK